MLLASALVGFLGVCGEGKACGSGGADLSELVCALVDWVSSVGAVVGWGVRVATVGFHALHWNMLSCCEFGGCMWVRSVLLLDWVVMCMIGGSMLGLGVVVVYFVGESGCGVVVL